MRKQKYYAVRVGRERGIYTSWTKCQEQIAHFSGARYKSFFTMDEAQAYMTEPQKQADPNALVAYVDGSYDAKAQRYSFGAVYILPDGQVETQCGAGDIREYAVARNVAGELMGAMRALVYAKKNGFNSIVIKHDYEGIACWATGAWKANSPAARAFVDFVKKFTDLNISFEKVPAHSGVEYNEMADQLAKEALKEAVNG